MTSHRVTRSSNGDPPWPVHVRSFTVLRTIRCSVHQFCTSNVFQYIQTSLPKPTCSSGGARKSKSPSCCSLGRTNSASDLVNPICFRFGCRSNFHSVSSITVLKCFELKTTTTTANQDLQHYACLPHWRLLQVPEGQARLSGSDAQ